MRSNPSIEGSIMPNLVDPYADDTTFFVRYSHSLQMILKIMKTFQEYSSLKINVEKCEAC